MRAQGLEIIEATVHKIVADRFINRRGSRRTCRRSGRSRPEQTRKSYVWGLCRALV